MDSAAIGEYHIPIELLMENAGLRLAELASKMAAPGSRVLVGVGPGNNGGGGLVAARRLSAWGYKVHLETSELPPNALQQQQLQRALAVGVRNTPTEQPELYIDAWFGFSQRLPLPKSILLKISEINKLTCPRLSLDIPTGFSEGGVGPYVEANIILSLAAPKKILTDKRIRAGLFMADLGFPKKLYDQFDTDTPPFHVSGILGWKI
jgi:NAD(P)H-hydrate epimerase